MGSVESIAIESRFERSNNLSNVGVVYPRFIDKGLRQRGLPNCGLVSEWQNQEPNPGVLSSHSSLNY